MEISPMKMASKTEKAQRAYLEWDKTYAYYQLGFNPRLI